MLVLSMAVYLTGHCVVIPYKIYVLAYSLTELCFMLITLASRNHGEIVKLD